MPAKLWPRHLDSRGSTADCRTTTTAAEAAPAIEAYLDPRVHCLAPHGIFSRCDIAVTEQMRLMAALLRSRDMAGSLSSAGSSWQGLEIRDWRRLGLAHGFRVVEGVPICCFPIVQMGDDPCEAEWHRPATAIRALGGPSHALEIAAAATATTAPRHRRVQTLQTLFHTYGAAHPHGRMDLVQRNRFSDASRCLGSATTLEVDGHENRVLSAERPNDGLKR
ncbi:hypothetical protein N431DRAFT_20380 [Stipitochalara longipes BDJ]|nr:hypothetical protein N431DRAFT_20380 [Stipitochalara longipes BDJ]